MSDGVATDQQGNHYITDLGGHGISKLDKMEILRNSLKIQNYSGLIILQFLMMATCIFQSTNFITTTAFSGQPDAGKPPYFIYRVKL